MALKLFWAIILLNLLLILFACSSPTDTPSTAANTSSTPSITPSTTVEVKAVPEFIIDKGNQFIISKVGLDYFSKYITFNPYSSRYVEGTDYPHIASAYLRSPYYFMVYSFKIPDKPFVDESISFSVDLDGNVVSEPDGIPNRLADPQEGEFSIDEEMAISIARKAGLEAGIRDWKTSFHWYAGNLKTYVWTVDNTLFSSDDTAWGRTIIIDANDGKVLLQSSWQSILDLPIRAR